VAITESTKPSGLSICTLWSAPATCKISIWGPQYLELAIWGPQDLELAIWGPQDLELAIWGPDPCSRAASMV
jgi:hypothetical protein